MYNKELMKRVPLVLLAARPCIPVGLSQDFDRIASEDSLPSAVEISDTGIATARVTRITEVKPETTDDK